MAKFEFRVFDSGYQYESWEAGQLLHNDKGPTEITYHNNGLRLLVRYHKMGVLHRKDGPAVETTGLTAFYLYGMTLRFSEWIQIVKDGLTTEQYNNLVERYGK